MTFKQLEDFFSFAVRKQILVTSRWRLPLKKSKKDYSQCQTTYLRGLMNLQASFLKPIQSFFVKGFLPKGLNSTILALIPKKEEAIEKKDYRPISLCNVCIRSFRKS